jgi:hypothetical protein
VVAVVPSVVVPVTVTVYAPAVVVAVVVAVRVAVPAVVLEIDKEVGERLHVAGLVSLAMLSVTAQLSVTVPVHEFSGVTVMVEVPGVPAATVMLPLLVSAISVLPAGAAQKFLHPERKPTAMKLIPRTQMQEKPIWSGAAKLRSRASCPKIIAAPLGV